MQLTMESGFTLAWCRACPPYRAQLVLYWEGPDTTRLVIASHPHTLIHLPQWENGQVTEFLVATQGWLRAQSTNGWSLGCLNLPPRVL